MCGIAGTFRLVGHGGYWRPDLHAMIALIGHRGPDGLTVHENDRGGLAHARLSIVDLAGGAQPISNESNSIWVICNGEIYNHIELRRELCSRGHCFRTKSDTEVMLHLYEERGLAFVDQLNGQFAFAIWDCDKDKLVLGRDRLGVRPLFFTFRNGFLLFASEVKAILAAMEGTQRVDYRTVSQIFTTWSPLTGHTMFEDIQELMPGHIMVATPGQHCAQQIQYWRLDFPDSQQQLQDTRSELDYAELLRESIVHATKLRLRADVEVGAYLSGGLDSSIIAAAAQQLSPSGIHTFSIAFDDPHFDERMYQEQVAQLLGTIHHAIKCDAEMIRQALPDVVWHTEVPFLRAAPVPMFLLSNEVRRLGLKVVLTGEGADEFLVGYDIFKETMVRRFWAKVPDSRLRPLLLRAIYPHSTGLQGVPESFLGNFFRQDLAQVASPYYSHLVRWRNTARLTRLFSAAVRDELGDYRVLDEIEQSLPDDMHNWSAIAQAQYVETTTFLSSYLLSTQGDRVAMAHGIEGRYPFLDHHVIGLCNSIPAGLKLKGIGGEKHILRRAFGRVLPSQIIERPKQPYRAPINGIFTGTKLPEYAKYLLSPKRIEEAHCFDPGAVSRLVHKVHDSQFIGEMDQMALMGVLTYQILFHSFITEWTMHARAHAAERQRIVAI